MRTTWHLLWLLVFTAQTGCTVAQTDTVNSVELIVLGNVQDAGAPQIGCTKSCCASLTEADRAVRKVSSLGVFDAESGQSFIFDATPDLTDQAAMLKRELTTGTDLPSGIFLTHAHIGHYTGLMYLGKEATSADRMPVYAMPKMRRFLQENGPWSQLVANENISLQRLTADSSVILSNNLRVTPIRVPHRDEFSETVGFRIEGPNRSALFIPDIDKWERWDRMIEQEIAGVDYAFLDGTFYDAAELNTRDISQIPHPFVSESMARFANLPKQERRKIHFIHFNHTNQLLNGDSAARKAVTANGFRVADHGLRVSL